ncbi:MAG: DUF2149 domain-containing protein [Oscillospiraceae bacterium]|nr:DUF2149 domain-containing protein [Oscillospiraceae bacterium]
MQKRLSRTRISDDFTVQGDVNPMELVANLVDAMLVLAVGIMLALIVAWNVDVGATTPNSALSEQEMEELPAETQSLSTVEKEDSVPVDQSGLHEYGTVYADEDGNLYIMESGN